MTQAAQGTARWCRHCGEPVTEQATGRAVHCAGGGEKCADGEHVAAPAAVDPAMTAAARAVGEGYPGWLVAWDGSRFLAWARGRPMPVPLETVTEAEMRARLAAETGSAR